MKKHLIIRDADTNEEFETEELEPSADIDAEEPSEKPEIPADVPADGCSCFTEEETASLKELIKLLPKLADLLEYEEKEHAKEPEDVEVKEVEEEKPEEDEDDKDEESDDSCITDSIGANEPIASKNDNDYSDQEAEMATRFSKYYGGK